MGSVYIMDEKLLRELIERIVLIELAKAGDRFISVQISDDITPSGAEASSGISDQETGPGSKYKPRTAYLPDNVAEIYGLRNGDKVSVETDGDKAICFKNVLVQTGDDDRFAVCLCLDEARVAGVQNGTFIRIVDNDNNGRADLADASMKLKQYSGNDRSTVLFFKQDCDENGRRSLMNESDIKDAFMNGYRSISCSRNTIITPLARDFAWENGIKILMIEEEQK
ncbi:MAG: putative phosphotransacetylase [Clostridiales bacterium]|nr:putative phosphotransacetylase [Clostridiales bacterium]